MSKEKISTKEYVNGSKAAIEDLKKNKHLLTPADKKELDKAAKLAKKIIQDMEADKPVK